MENLDSTSIIVLESYMADGSFYIFPLVKECSICNSRSSKLDFLPSTYCTELHLYNTISPFNLWYCEKVSATRFHFILGGVDFQVIVI